MAKKYIDAEKLKAEVKRYKNKADERLKIKGRTFSEEQKDLALQNLCGNLLYFISSLQQEQPEENNLPSKRTRVNYAICKLQSFKPLREAIVLDDYVYDEGKCYRENLLNYIHAIPENRLKEIRHYLQEKGWWPYDDDADWMEQEQPEVDLEKEINKEISKWTCYEEIGFGARYDAKPFDGRDIEKIARHFYKLGLKARKEGNK